MALKSNAVLFVSGMREGREGERGGERVGGSINLESESGSEREAEAV